MGILLNKLGTNNFGIDGYENISKNTIWTKLSKFWARFNLKCNIAAISYIIVNLNKTLIYLEELNLQMYQYC